VPREAFDDVGIGHVGIGRARLYCVRVISASLYIIACSARNRLRQRLRRLREPRYLIGAVVGVGYFYFSVFARFRVSRRAQTRRRSARSPTPLAVLSAVRSAAPGVVGIGLFAVTALAWVLPFDSGLLAFSESEIQFLFPAPVSRRELLIHRLLRSQIGLLFGSLIAAVVAPSISGYSRVRIAVAMWLLLTTGKVFFTGVTLARTRLTSPDARTRSIAWLPAVVLGAALSVVAAAVLRAFDTAPAGIQDVFIRVGTVTSSGWSSIVLWPFIALAQPLFAEWPRPYLTSLALASSVMLVTLVWVLQSDAAFEDAAAIDAQQRTQDVKRQAVAYRTGGSGLPLALRGRAELAFAWKGATQTLRAFGKAAIIRVAALAAALTMAGVSIGRESGLAAMVGTLAVLLCGFTVILAPQALRVDMREDLQHLEVLKTWPVRAGAIVRGELLWPGVLLTVIAWIGAGIAEMIGGPIFGRLGAAWRASAGLAFAVIAPALIFAQLTIHNAAALIFPAWVPQGYQRARGLDALGQRLIMLFGTWIALAIAALPGAIAGGIVWLVFSRAVGTAAATIPAAFVGATALAIEVLAATEALGPAYERLDVTAVERSE
jgi:hypothetical protein